MRFRPLLVPTLWFAAMLLTLAGLGTWQLERLHWKEALIARMNANLSAPALSLDEIAKLPTADAQYRRVTLTGRFDHAHEAYAFATAEGGEPVYHVLTPLILKDGKALIVDRGMIPPIFARSGHTRRRAGERAATRHRHLAHARCREQLHAKTRFAKAPVVRA